MKLFNIQYPTSISRRKMVVVLEITKGQLIYLTSTDLDIPDQVSLFLNCHIALLMVKYFLPDKKLYKLLFKSI